MSSRTRQDPAQGRGGRDSTRRRALLIFTGALLLRLAIAAAYPPADAPEIAFYRGDAPAYHQYALALARGEAYDQGLPFHPPLLAFVTTPIYQLFAGTERLFPVLTLVVAALGSAVAVLTLLLGTRLAGPTVGLAAGVAVALHFGLAAASTTLNVESLSAALELGALLVLLGHPAMRDRWYLLRLLIAGALAGLAALARAENQLLVLALAAWVAWRPGERRRADPRSGLAILVGAFLVIAPWALRNAIVINQFNRTRAPILAEPLHLFAPVTMYGGLNFALANHPEATGSFSPAALAGDGQIDLSRPEHLEYLNHGFALGFGWIAADPAGSLRRVGHKIAIGLDALRLGYGALDRPAGISGERPAVDFFRPDRALLLAPHLLLIGAGAILLARRTGLRRALLLHLPVATHAIALVLFFGYARLLLVTMPILLVDAAVAGVVGWEALAGRIARWRGGSAAARRQGGRGTLWAAILLAMAVLEGGLLASRGQEMRYAGETERGGTRVNLDGPLRIWPASPEAQELPEPHESPGSRDR
jgi:hypothetical protein